MKKIVMMMVLLTFVFIGAKAGAAQINGNVEAKDVKIHKKQVLTDEERKILDEKSKGNLTTEDKGIFTLPATGELGAPLPAGGHKYAILVGLANYSGIISDLCVTGAKTKDPFPENSKNITKYCQDYDSMHMKEALVNQYGYDPNNITIIRDGSATGTNVKAAMNALQPKITSNDEVFFFYSGHGTTGNYSLPGVIDTTDTNNIDEGIYLYDGKVIWDDDLKQWADNMPAFRMVFAFDTCEAGGMNDIAGANRVILMSSGETQSSWTYYLGGYNTGTKKKPVYQYSEGLFAHYFVVDGISKGLADTSNLLANQDYKVAAEEAFGYAYLLVQLKQQPVLSDNFVNDLLLGYSL